MQIRPPIKLKEVKIICIDGFEMNKPNSVEINSRVTSFSREGGIPLNINLHGFRKAIGILQSLLYPNSDRLNDTVEGKSKLSFLFTVDDSTIKYDIVTEKGRVTQEQYYKDDELIYLFIRGEDLYFKGDFYSEEYKKNIVHGGNSIAILSNLDACYPSNKYYFHSLISYIKNIHSLYLNFDQFLSSDVDGVLDWVDYMDANNLLPQLQKLVSEYFGECYVTFIEDWGYNQISLVFPDKRSYDLSLYMTNELSREIRKLIIKDMIDNDDISLLIVDAPVGTEEESTSFYDELVAGNTQIAYPTI